MSSSRAKGLNRMSSVVTGCTICCNIKIPASYPQSIGMGFRMSFSINRRLYINQLAIIMQTPSVFCKVGAEFYHISLTLEDRIIPQAIVHRLVTPETRLRYRGRPYEICNKGSGAWTGFPPSTPSLATITARVTRTLLFVIRLSEGKASDAWKRLHQPFLAWGQISGRFVNWVQQNLEFYFHKTVTVIQVFIQ